MRRDQMAEECARTYEMQLEEEGKRTQGWLKESQRR